MAHLMNDKRRISQEQVFALKDRPLKLRVWGPIDEELTKQEVELVAVRTSTQEPSITLSHTKAGGKVLPITNNVRSWTVVLSNYARARIQIIARGGDVWDWVDLIGVPRTYVNLLPEQRLFIEEMAIAGRQAAKDYVYPLSGMLAVACYESQFGIGKKYKRTGCPFNLQKPDEWEYPKCKTETSLTINKEGEKPKNSPFCLADSLAHAAELWCQWIDKYPTVSQRDALLKFRHDGKAFAENTFMVGFADNKASKTKQFGTLWTDYELNRYDPAAARMP